MTATAPAFGGAPYVRIDFEIDLPPPALDLNVSANATGFQAALQAAAAAQLNGLEAALDAAIRQLVFAILADANYGAIDGNATTYVSAPDGLLARCRDAVDEMSGATGLGAVVVARDIVDARLSELSFYKPFRVFASLSPGAGAGAGSDNTESSAIASQTVAASVAGGFALAVGCCMAAAAIVGARKRQRAATKKEQLQRLSLAALQRQQPQKKQPRQQPDRSAGTGDDGTAASPPSPAFVVNNPLLSSSSSVTHAPSQAHEQPKDASVRGLATYRFTAIAGGVASLGDANRGSTGSVRSGSSTGTGAGAESVGSDGRRPGPLILPSSRGGTPRVLRVPTVGDAMRRLAQLRGYAAPSVRVLSVPTSTDAGGVGGSSGGRNTARGADSSGYASLGDASAKAKGTLRMSSNGFGVALARQQVARTPSTSMTDEGDAAASSSSSTADPLVRNAVLAPLSSRRSLVADGFAPLHPRAALGKRGAGASGVGSAEASGRAADGRHVSVASGTSIHRSPPRCITHVATR
jgi:hypothetical protein